MLQQYRHAFSTLTTMDPITLILAALLAATLIAFAFGWIPYPFGWLVLSLLLVARFLHLRRRNP